MTKDAAQNQLNGNPDHYTDRFEILHQIDQTILTSHSAEPVFEMAFSGLKQLLSYQRASIIEFNFATGQGTVVALRSESATRFKVGHQYQLSDLGRLPALQPDQYLLIEDLSTFARRSLSLDYLTAEGFRSLLCLPLSFENNLMGALALSAVQANAFSQEHIEFARKVTDSLAIAFYNHRLRKAEQQARSIAEALQAAALALTTSLNLETVLDTLLDQLQLLVPYDTANVMLVEESGSQVTMHSMRNYAHWTDPGRFRQITFDTRTTPTIQAILKTKKSLLISDTNHYPGWQHRAGTEYIRNWMGIPLISNNRAIGLYSLDKAQANFFTRNHLKLAEMLAPQAALATQNAQLYHNAQQRLNELNLLFNASTAVSTILDVNAVVKIIVKEVVSAINADNCALSLWQREQDAVITLFDYAGESSESEEAPGTVHALGDYPIIRQVLSQNQPIVIQQADPEAAPVETALLKEWEVNTLLMLPLTVRDQVIGLLEVMTVEERIFSSSDMRLCQTLANHLAVALENARLFEKIQNQAAQLEQRVTKRTAELNRTNKQLQQEVFERKKAAQDLRLSQQKYQMLVERMNDGIAICNSQNLITYTNNRFNAMLGYTPGELTGCRLDSLFDEANQKILQAQLATHVSDSNVYEIVMTGKDSRQVPVIVSPSPVFDAAGRFQGSFAVYTDITERRLAEEALRKSEEQFRLIFELAPIGIALAKLDGTLVQTNQALRHIFGYTATEIAGRSFKDISHPDDIASDVALQQQLVQGKIPYFKMEKRYLHRQGHIVYTLLQVALMRNSTGAPIYFIAQIIDITERKQAEAQLLHHALHDTLTNLPNRALFLHHLERSIEHARQQSNYKFAVLLLDLDRFKLINDSLGHTLGDELLVAIAERLKEHIRPGDVVARLGGDEFAILFAAIKTENKIEQLAHQIQYQVGRPFKLQGQDISVTVSIGITFSSRGYTNPEDFLRDADTAMNRAKTKGGATHVMFDTKMHVNILMRLSLETELRQAFERRELEVYYQPIVSMNTHQIIKFEALLRWPHVKQGFIPPAKFIPIAEETGLIIPIGEWMMHTACAQVNTWLQSGYPGLRLAVNISVREFQYQNLPTLIKKILHDTGLNPDALELEITESIAMHNEDFSLDPLLNLNQMGVQLAIDDFGTGYSSLSRLKSLPVSTLKIDQSFIKDIPTDAESKTITTAIIAMAHALQLKVVAEGVETVEQLNFLRTQQCDELQGYIFSPPIPAQKSAFLLQTRSLLLSKRHDATSQS